MVKLAEQKRLFACDFETTVYSGQDHTEVWASAFSELFTADIENAVILGSIEDTLNYFERLNCDCVLYYHNLKFDGSFWLNHILRTSYTEAYITHSSDDYIVEFLPPKQMPNKSFNYSISSDGLWYRITLKTFRGHFIEIRDSLKLFPFTLKQVGEAFKTKHRKLSMEYDGYRHANCYISPEEQEYIKNDVLVLREALEFIFTQGLNKMTIGSCCMDEYKKLLSKTRGKKAFKHLFPTLDKRIGKHGEIYNTLDKSIYGSKTYDEYIRKSYRGGWCYLVEEKANKIFKSTEQQSEICGTTADVNSLYPSMMHSKSGNYYPTGQPHFWKGEIPLFLRDKYYPKYYYYFIRVKCRFELKEGMLPIMQIKGSPYYHGTEMLRTSDYIDNDGEQHSFGQWYDWNGDSYWGYLTPTLTLTCVDWEMFQKHYYLYDVEILDGCWFYAKKGIFDNYIDKWNSVKANSKGAMRTEAKLFLNNLYGKFATSTNGDFKIAYIGEMGELKFRNVREVEKDSVYIPIGSAITSYARRFTITAAQLNYHGINERGFIYADTDSIHCDLKPDEIVGIDIHETNLCCWKLESCWDEALYVRQKTYIEHFTHENGEPIEKPFYEIKCAGMPFNCKQQFVYSLTQDIPEEWLEKATPEEKQFVSRQRSLKEFRVGLKIHGKLTPKQIKGGVILTKTDFEMQPKGFIR